MSDSSKNRYHRCHAYFGETFDETHGAPSNCTDIDPETSVCGMCGTDTRATADTTADRDALAEAAEALRQAGRDGYLLLDGESVPWEVVARWLDARSAALAVRPAPDTLAAHVQALADRWECAPAERWWPSPALHVAACPACSHAAALRALLAGQPDASPDNKEN